MNQPYKSQLVDLRVPVDELANLNDYAKNLPSIRLTEREAFDLELLATGALSPLNQFMGQANYESVLDSMRLSDGTLFSIPITLSVPQDAPISLDTDIALRTRRNYLLAIMTVQEIYQWDVKTYTAQIVGTQNPRHPLVSEANRWGELNIAGSLRILSLPRHYDFTEFRRTPQQTRAHLSDRGKHNVISFQTRKPMNRAQEAMLKQALSDIDATLLLQPIVGITTPDDVDHYTRVRANSLLAEAYFNGHIVEISLLPFAMRMSGVRDAILQTIIARNYGATHIPIGHYHADYLKLDAPTTAYDAVMTYQDELGVKVLPYDEWVYLPGSDSYHDMKDVDSSHSVMHLTSSRMQHDYLDKGEALPDWFVRPEVADVLVRTYPPKHKRGVCIWFTGLSGSGKSTTASILSSMVRAHGRQTTLLDGDIVRMNLSRGLGFSKADRDTNIRRIGFVAAEIVRHGGVVICATISPYRATRADVRQMVGEGFIEVFVDTPLEVCEARDTKGLYARARRGQIKGFTGIDDPYEKPVSPEIHLNTVSVAADRNARDVLNFLIAEGYIKSTDS